MTRFEIARRVLNFFADQKDSPLEKGSVNLLATPEAAYCRGTHCWDEPAITVMDKEEYAAMEAALSEATSREPPGGWATYCRDHITIIGTAGRVDPTEPPWREDLVGCRVDGCPGYGGSSRRSRDK